MSFWEIIKEEATAGNLFNAALTSVLTLYGFLFVCNILCLVFILKKFFVLYNVQSDNNFVMSSSDMFSDNKGTMPMRAWLLLLIPFFYIYFIIYYALQLKKLYPNANVPVKAFALVTVVITAICLIASFALEFIAMAYSDVAGYSLFNRNLALLPHALVAIGNAVCFYLMLKTARENFSLSDTAEE